MMNLKLDGTGDLVITADVLQLVEGLEEDAQLAKVYLQSNKREWFLDPEAGTDHAVFRTKVPNKDAIRAALADGLEQTGRFRSLDDVTVDFDRSRRILRVSFRATTIDGDSIEREVDLDAG